VSSVLLGMLAVLSATALVRRARIRG